MRNDTCTFMVRHRLTPTHSNVDEPARPEPGYGNSWDEYVVRARANGHEWPGDEWGDPDLWRRWFDVLFVPFGVAEWSRAVEIGQGTGKYTRLALDAGCETILACDVAQSFLDLCRDRLADDVAKGRVAVALLDERDPQALRNVVVEHGWEHEVDAVFSIDALVHVPFTFIASYLLQASAVLRENGRFITTFANGVTDAGQHKLLDDVDRVVRAGASPDSGCFHWIAPDLIARTAESIGYRVDVCGPDPVHGRDGHFVATLVDLDRANAARTLAS